MKLKLNLRNAKTKSRRPSKRSIFVTKPFQTLRANRRAINAVISNIILIAAVIAVGFAVLVWSQYQSAHYQTEYSSEVNANIAQVQEKVVFEYVAHVGNQLKVYLINCGTQNVNITTVYVNSNQNFTNVSLIDLSTNAPTSGNLLNVGEQAYFTVGPVSDPYVYTVKIKTERGSTFVRTL